MGVTSLARAKIRPGVERLVGLIREIVKGQVEHLPTSVGRWLTGADLQRAMSGATVLYREIHGAPCTIELLPDGGEVWLYLDGDVDKFRIWIDGEQEPRFHGTGHEDEYHGGWSTFWLENPYSLPLVGEPKFDGVSVEIIYEDGRYATAATRGDGRTGDVVERVYRDGGVFQEWTEQFRFDRWQRAWGEAGLGPEDITGPRQVEEHGVQAVALRQADRLAGAGAGRGGEAGRVGSGVGGSTAGSGASDR